VGEKSLMARVNYRVKPEQARTTTLSISNVDRAYLAALIDGEGSIAMGLTKYGKAQLSMMIANTHLERLTLRGKVLQLNCPHKVVKANVA
jgi:hypothetical protein